MLKNVKKVIKMLKPNQSPASAYKIIALPVGKYNYKFVVNVEKAPITALTKHYLVDKPREMFNLVGKKISHKRSFDGYATLDIGSLAASNKESIRNFGEGIPKMDIFIGEYKDELVAGVCRKGGCYIDIKTENISGVRSIPIEVAMDSFGHPRKGWHRYGDFKIFGASKGRKNVFDMFEQNTNFEAYIDAATYGEYFKVKGTKVTQKELADAITRLGAKSCAMGAEDILIENIVIILDKDANLDGTGLLANVDGIPDGLLVQQRCLTSKSTVFTVSPKFLARVLERFNVTEFDKCNLSTETSKLLDVALNKSDRRKAKMSNKDLHIVFDGNAVALIGNPNKGIQMIGDLNFWKDKWDYSRTSGLNALDVASYKNKEFGAATSGQFNKLVLGAKALASAENACKIDKFYKRIIKREITRKLSYDGKGEYDGTEYLDMNYLAGTYSQLPIQSWTNEPAVFEAVLEEKLKSLKDVFVRDRYHIAGHSAMCMADLAYWLTGEKILGIEKDEEGNIMSFEGFDPAANQYIKEHFDSSMVDAETMKHAKEGFVVKYPSMGTREGCFVNFVDLGEINRRINSNDNICTRDKYLLIDAYASVQVGAIVCPAYLTILAMILAGYDLDGDHFEVYFTEPSGYGLPQMLRDAGFVPIAVQIDTGKDENTEEITFDLAQWATYSAMLIANNNKSVGVVTNTFRLFTDGLLTDLKNDKLRLAFYRDLLVNIGGTCGDKDYESVVECTKDENGVVVYRCSNESVKKFIESALKDINYENPENIVKILNDMDKLGRACQELTIDAQKKFYNVFCKWMEDTNNYSLFCLKVGFEFRIVRANREQRIGWEFCSNCGYVVNQETGFVEIPDPVVVIEGEYSDTTIIADASSRYRLYAANVAMKMIPEMFKAYNEAYSRWEMNASQRALEATILSSSLDKVGLANIELVSRALRTVDKSRLDFTRKLNELYSMEEERGRVPLKIREKIERDIRKSANVEYAETLENISNEIRRIVKNYSMNMEDVANYINLSGMDNSMKILKPERFLQKIKHICPVVAIESPYYLEEGVTKVISRDGYLVSCGRDFAKMTASRTNLIEGEYAVKEDVNTHKAVLSRKVEDFVVIPEVEVNDDERIVMGYVEIPARYDIEYIRQRADNAFRVDRKVKIAYKQGKFGLFDIETEECFAVLNFGGNTGKIKGKQIAKDYNKFEGMITSKVLCVNEDVRTLNYVVSIKK